jgi:amidophosphoribosyltransferase
MCGIFGISGNKEASKITYLGLYALQHRGQEGAGIVSSDGEIFYEHRKLGYVTDRFSDRVIDGLKGTNAIGHVRYSTTGENIKKNIQPFSVDFDLGTISVSHNGNLVNYDSLKRELEGRGAVFQSTMDTELILHLVAREKGTSIEKRIKDAVAKCRGAYSLLFLFQDKLIAVRDPHGFRPLVMGKLGQSTVFASETTSLDLIGAEYVREVEPGEIISVQGKQVKSIYIPKKRRLACVFEHIYFARPDTLLFGKRVYEVRKNLGKELYRIHKLHADMILPVPDSGVLAAMGYAEESGDSFELALVRNHYIGRTFIQPAQSIRDFGVKVKLNPVKSFIKGKSVIVVDDSIVRGTTSKKIIKMLADAGASKIHMMISAPPTTGPCFYGIDTPTKEELIASSKSVEEIRKFIGADSLNYMTIDGLYRAVGEPRDLYCDACFSGEYLV